MSGEGAAIYTPRTCEETLRIWARVPDARLLSGGTDLLVRLKDALQWPVLIDISHVEELRGISVDGAWLRIGARTSYTELERHAAAARYADVLRAAAREVGAPAIRNRGTLGGNLANASPAGDTIPALYALDAEIELRTAGETRHVPVAEFLCGPGRTVLKSQELICAVRIPLRPAWRGAFARLGQRSALAISKVSAAVRVWMQTGVVKDVRIALGAVAPTVLRVHDAEERVRGTRLADADCTAAGEEAARTAAPISDIRSDAAYRRAMCAVLVRDALRQCRPAGAQM